MGWMTQASTGAQRADLIFLWVLGISVVILLGITATMILFVVRYSRKRNRHASQIEGHVGLEITWTLVPLAVFLAIFYYGWTNYEYMANAPADAMVVQVTGRQWNWSFQYPNQKQAGVLYAALGRPVKLEVRSLDVIHGFFIPAFRLKIDAVPGKLNTAWFQPTLAGTYDIECTVICGVDHSSMLSKVVVVPEAEFRRWYFGDENTPAPSPTAPPAAQAGPAAPLTAEALMAQHDCRTCHSIDGKPMVGPTFKGLFGTRVEVRAGGRVRPALVDEAFLRKALLHPGAQRLKGYPDVMPVVALKPADVETLVAYLKGLR